MSNENNKFNSLAELKNLFTEKELVDKKNTEEKQKYQENWVRTTNGHRKMIAKKNRKWLLENKDCELKEYVEFPVVYDKIKSIF